MSSDVLSPEVLAFFSDEIEKQAFGPMQALGAVTRKGATSVLGLAGKGVRKGSEAAFNLAKKNPKAAVGVGVGTGLAGYVGGKGVLGAKQGLQKSRQFGPLPGTTTF